MGGGGEFGQDLLVSGTISWSSAEVRLREAREGRPGPGTTSGQSRAARVRDDDALFGAAMAVWTEARARRTEWKREGILCVRV